jgi:hypothetical protein
MAAMTDATTMEQGGRQVKTTKQATPPGEHNMKITDADATRPKLDARGRARERFWRTISREDGAGEPADDATGDGGSHRRGAVMVITRESE